MSDFPVNPLVLIGVGSSFAFSGLFYHLYQEKKKELERLKEIPIFKPDQHLVRVLKASPHRRLQYVAVEGVVQADGEPLASQFVPRCFGVIQKTTVHELCCYWDSLSTTWNSQTLETKFVGLAEIVRGTFSSVPFSLVSPGSYINDFYVKVEKPLEADECHLENTYFKEGSLPEVISREKPVLLEESEEMLRVGGILTGFGEVVLEGGQVMRLQAPQDGRTYILAATDYRSFMDKQEKSVNMWKMLTALTGLTGASLLAEVVYSLVRKQDDRSS